MKTLAEPHTLYNFVASSRSLSETSIAFEERLPNDMHCLVDFGDILVIILVLEVLFWETGFAGYHYCICI